MRRIRRRKVRVWHETNEPTIGKKINWKGWGAKEIVKILSELMKVDEVPTIRGVWYILVSKFPQHIPNTRTIYQSYDHVTVLCRKREIGYPSIAEDAFSDDTRIIIEIDKDSFIDGQKVADIVIQNVKDARPGYYIPRWYMQKNYCEFWVEKRAITRMFMTILRNGDIDRQVRIVPNSGWTSFTYVKKNIGRLYKHWNSKFRELGSVVGEKSTYPHIWIFYSGDCDPSGRRMDINLVKEIVDNFRKRFERKMMTDPTIHPNKMRGEVSRRMTTIHFMRVTVKQIAEFNLKGLTDPEPETVLKLEGGWDESKGRNKKGDPNTNWFKKMFKWYGNGTVFQIELDAMYARREQFKKLLLDLVDSKFDDDIYQKYVLENQEVERDLLTMRLKDKLINEKIELPGWKQIESRINTLKAILSEMADRSFLMNLMFSTMLSALINQKKRESG
jgi:hypothetical protein